MGESSFKRLRTGNVDRLSSLSDDILGYILSFLPTKCAVATSVLSCRWINVWTLVPVLDFSHFHKPQDPVGAAEAFMDFADNVISLNRSANIGMFRLHYAGHFGKYLSRINDWANNAISRKVSELDLQVGSFSKAYDEKNMMRLLSCDSLQVLNISGNVNLHVPQILECFSNLRKFSLRLDYADNDFSSKIFSSLPRLEVLSMCLGLMEEYIEFNIATPVLKMLEIELQNGEAMYHDIKILINAPVLEHFSFKNDYLNSYSLEGLPFGVQAKINVAAVVVEDPYDKYDISTFKLIHGFSGVKSLSISINIMQIISLAYEEIENLPTFHSLTKLQLHVDDTMRNLSLCFLKRAPNLEIFVIEWKELSDYRDEDESWESDGFSLVHLKEIVIISARPKKFKEMKLMTYIMEYIEVPDNVTVNFVPPV